VQRKKHNHPRRSADNNGGGGGSPGLGGYSVAIEEGWTQRKVAGFQGKAKRVNYYAIQPGKSQEPKGTIAGASNESSSDSSGSCFVVQHRISFERSMCRSCNLIRHMGIAVKKGTLHCRFDR
jgi:hypothetical protein